jgi:hypothetical protein
MVKHMQTIHCRSATAVLALLAVSACGSPEKPAAAAAQDARIVKLVAAVSKERIKNLDEKLASFGTRSTLSDTTSPSRGIGAARQWIFDELKRSSPRLQVSFETFQLAPQARVPRVTELRNVIAILPGRSPRRIYVTGHYDTLNAEALGKPGPDGKTVTYETLDFNADAPGANDDGSGTSLTMELARVFAESGIEFDATLVFACWAGEEQGLYGSTAHAEALLKTDTRVEANISNDIVGGSHGGNGVVENGYVRLYAEGPVDSPSRALARFIHTAAARYVPDHPVQLMARIDRFGRGSDHMGFSARGYPAVVFREARENYAKQHSAADTLDGVDFDYLALNARVNAAAVAALALAPAAPTVVQNGRPMIGRGPSGYDANLSWQAVPGATAYRIYRRKTWSYDWEDSWTTGNVTNFVLPNVSIDDYVFGVAAVGADGSEGIISAYVEPGNAVEYTKLAN